MGGLARQLILKWLQSGLFLGARCTVFPRVVAGPETGAGQGVLGYATQGAPCLGSGGGGGMLAGGDTGCSIQGAPL